MRPKSPGLTGDSQTEAEIVLLTIRFARRILGAGKDAAGTSETGRPRL